MKHIKVLLVGSPTAHPAEHVHEVDTLSDKIRLATGNGYHHFTYSGESRELNGARLPVFQWCYQTKLAE